MSKKIIILAILVVLVSLLTISIFIPAYLSSQSDKLGLILYNCALGFERTGPLMLLTFDNGTHTINEESYVWIEITD